MINLLSQDEKKKLRREYYLRFGIIALCAFFVLEMLSLLLFTPAYYTLYLSTKDLSEGLLEKRALAPMESDEAQKNLTKIKKEIAQLQPSLGIVDVPLSVLFAEIVAQKPGGIELNMFAYIRSGNSVSMQVSGVAQTQEDLIAFRRDIKTNPRILDFKYGSSFITKKSNIDFNAVSTFK